MSRLSAYVEPVRGLAGEGLTDSQIGARLGLSRRQVGNLRLRYEIPAAHPGQRMVKDPTVDIGPDGSASKTWCSMLAAADEATFTLMRRAVCRCLGVDYRASDESLVRRAQLDRRSAEQLASAYLRELAGVGG